MITGSDCLEFDARDPLRDVCAHFAQPSQDTVYLDGNSLGAMPADVPERVQALLLDGWRDARRRGWSHSDWLEKPWLLGESLAHLPGVGAGEVVFSDSTSVNPSKLCWPTAGSCSPRAGSSSPSPRTSRSTSTYPKASRASSATARSGASSRGRTSCPRHLMRTSLSSV